MNMEDEFDMSVETDRGLVASAKPEIRVFVNQGGEISILAQFSERDGQDIVSIPIDCAQLVADELYRIYEEVDETGATPG